MASSGRTKIHISSAIFQSSSYTWLFSATLTSPPQPNEDAAATKAFRLNDGREIFILPTLLIFLFPTFFLFFFLIFGKTILPPIF